MAIPILLKRGVVQTLGPYSANGTDAQILVLPVDAAGDQALEWQTVLGGTGSFTSITSTMNGSLDGLSFSLYDSSTAVGGEIRFPAGTPQAIQMVISNLVVAAGSPTMKVLVKVR